MLDLLFFSFLLFFWPTALFLNLGISPIRQVPVLSAGFPPRQCVPHFPPVLKRVLLLIFFLGPYFPPPFRDSTVVLFCIRGLRKDFSHGSRQGLVRCFSPFLGQNNFHPLFRIQFFSPFFCFFLSQGFCTPMGFPLCPWCGLCPCFSGSPSLRVFQLVWCRPFPPILSPPSGSQISWSPNWFQIFFRRNLTPFSFFSFFFPFLFWC